MQQETCRKQPQAPIYFARLMSPEEMCGVLQRRQDLPGRLAGDWVLAFETALDAWYEARGGLWTVALHRLESKVGLGYLVVVVGFGAWETRVLMPVGDERVRAFIKSLCNSRLVISVAAPEVRQAVVKELACDPALGDEMLAAPNEGRHVAFSERLRDMASLAALLLNADSLPATGGMRSAELEVVVAVVPPSVLPAGVGTASKLH